MRGGVSAAALLLPPLPLPQAVDETPQEGEDVGRGSEPPDWYVTSAPVSMYEIVGPLEAHPVMVGVSS